MAGFNKFVIDAENAELYFPYNVNTDRAKNVMNTVYNIFVLVSDEAKNGIIYEARHSKIIEFLNTIVSGGKEICTDSRINWHYPAYTAIMAMAKNTPSIWDDLSVETKNKIDLLMRCLLVTTNFIACDNNNYRTGIGLTGDVQKNWNPNVQMSLVMPIVFLSKFFGGSDAVDNILTAFDYDEYISEITAAGFANVLDIWTTPDFEVDGTVYPGAKKLLTGGHKAFSKEVVLGHTNVYPAAGGEGAKKPFRFGGYRSGNVLILKNLYSRNYSGGVIASRVYLENVGDYAHTVDDSTSPYEGQNSMMLEFSSDGRRSCARHSSVDFCIVTMSMYASLILGIIDNSFFNGELYQKIKAGNGDLFFKLEHGWHGYSLRGWNDVTMENLNIDPFDIMKAIWEEYLLK